MINTKTALVTGASSGIGKNIAKQLLKDGLTVIAAARSVDKMRDLEAGGAHIIELDVTNQEAVTREVEQINELYGGVDVLVNAAGFGLYGAIEDVTIEQARYQLEVNLFGIARLTQLFLPMMRSKGAGTIINISSMGGKVYTPLGAWYHASKHALEGWSDCLRLEVAQFGINVVIIEPGFIQTEFSNVLKDPLLKISGHGAYSAMAKAFAKQADAASRSGGTDPQVIAKVISSAIKARRPRTRYVAGKYAKPMMWIRKYLGDRVFDRIILSTLR